MKLMEIVHVINSTSEAQIIGACQNVALLVFAVYLGLSAFRLFRRG